MKTLNCFLTILSIVQFSFAQDAGAGTISMASPDHKVSVTVSLSDAGQPQYALNWKDASIVESSATDITAVTVDASGRLWRLGDVGNLTGTNAASDCVGGSLSGSGLGCSLRRH